MNIQIYGKNKCFDTKKAERWFKERRISFQMIDLPRYGMSAGELKNVIKAIGSLDDLIDENVADSSVIKYLAYEEDKFLKLLENPKLLKTPIVRNGKQATVGFCPDIWNKWE